MNLTLLRLAAPLLLLPGIIASAQAPRIGYQAYLTNAIGTPVDGAVAIEISLWTDPTSGDQDDFLYLEQHPAIDVDQGLVNVLIGTGQTSQTQDPLGDEMLSGAVWLQIEVEGETLSPRRQIHPAARANRAAIAEGVETGSIASNSVANDSLTAIDLSDEAGVISDDGDQTVELTVGPHQGIRLMTLNAPADGYAIVTGSGTMGINPFASARCGVGLSSFVDDNRSVLGSAGSQFLNVPFSTTRVVAVSAGDNALRLVCRGLAPTVLIYDTALTAIYVPTQY